MPSLRDVQAAFGRALLSDAFGAVADGHPGATPGGEPDGLLAAIAGDGLAPAARLAIYRHHVAATLSDALKGAFPVVCCLVDERFFGYAADRFIAEHPPSSPCLHEFGARFPDFLATFEPCRHLAYLPDVARLEWAMARALQADDAAPLDPRVLGALAPEEIAGLVVRLDPSVTLLRSPWPIDRLWRANQPGADETAVLDLGKDGVCLEVRRAGDDVVSRACAPAAYALRRALHDGLTLGDAADAALEIDPAFDLAAAIRELVHDDVLVAFTLKIPREDPS